MLVLSLVGASLTLAYAPPAAGDEATRAMREALAEKADAPAELPELPSLASERAVLAQGETAHGRAGRAAHAAAGDAGASAEARVAAANGAARAAAAHAAAAARADARNAAGQARAEKAKKKKGNAGGGS
jgi:hypothetical protein